MKEKNCRSSFSLIKKSQVYKVIPKIIRNITPGGYVYIEDFTVSDPSYQAIMKRLKQIEENTFFSPKHSSYLYFFSRNELKQNSKASKSKPTMKES